MNVNKKKNLLILSVSLVLAIGIWYLVQAVVVKPQQPVWTSKIYAFDGGWAYDISNKNEVYIKQTFIPVVAGKKPFVTQKQAAAAAAMVIEKLNKGQLPGLDKDELSLILSFAE